MVATRPSTPSDDPAGPRASRRAAKSRRGLAGELAHLRQLVGLLDAIATARAADDPSELFRVACGGLAHLLGAERCTVMAEEPDGTLACRDGAPGDAPPAEAADLPSTGELARRLDAARAKRPPGAFVYHERAVPVASGGQRDLSVLAVPVGDRTLLALEGGVSWRCEPDEMAAVRVVAGLLEERSRGARRLREEEQHTTTARALRQLLEMGVKAGSAIEAAKALASTAARVLGFPVGCAYLVDEAGRITEVVSVGADRDRAKRLRDELVGQLAANSPVWRRTLLGGEVGPDLIDDTARRGVVRTNGVAHLLGLRSMAAIPLLSSEGPLGLVLCGDHVPRSRWRAGDRELLAQLSLEGAVVVDNARLREAERHEATHDALTGLLNRRAFSSLLRAALLASSRTDEPIAVLLVDLDRFKEVNDHLGHHCGDELLVAVSDRIRGCLGGGAELARLGGDEFAVLLAESGTRARAEAIAAELGLALAEPFEVGDSSLHVDASVGVACFPGHGTDADGLLQRADAAMYEAKRSGAGYVVYGPAVAARTAAELGLLGDLRRAVGDGRGLMLHFQPKVALASGRVTGIEALVRWDHPRHGMLLPGRFVPVAEETGIVRGLTAWVVPSALAQAADWRRAGIDLPMSVNVSARDLADRMFPERVARWLDEAGVPGHQLVVEVTEGALMSDPVATGATLQHLRDLGARVSLDDFGTGYSSLAYLETLPVDEVKMDRQFLHLGRSRGSVIRSIVALGHDLEMTVVAEGVETPEQEAWLAGVGCDEAQGFHVARPMAAAALEAWLEAARRAERAARA